MQQRADIRANKRRADRHTIRVTTAEMEAATENQNWKRNENETASAMKIRVHVKLEKVVSVPYLVFFPILLLFFWAALATLKGKWEKH